MGLLSQSSHGLTIVLAPFTGVNNGTSRLLKSITAAELATLREGDVIYVSSYRDYWKWLPNSTIAGDDTLYCAPTVVGVGPGRFERLLLASPDWLLQTAWFVDNTAANEEGSGLSLASPVKTDIEIGRRWGNKANLASSVIITYVNSPVAISNFDIQLLANGAITWLGAMAAPSKTGNITAVTAINRATQTPLDITVVGLGAADVRKFVRITASAVPARVGAYATVLKDLGGGKVRTTPFGTADVLTGFTAVTPAIGDTIEIVVPAVTLQPGKISISSASNLGPTAVPRANTFVFDSLKLDGTAFGPQQIAAFGTFGNYLRVEMANQTLTGLGATSIWCGGIQSARNNVRGSSLIAYSVGMFATMGVSPGASFNMQQDTTFQSLTQIPINMAVGSDVQSFGTAYFDSTSALGGCVVDNGCQYLQIGAIADWGTGNTTFGIRVRTGGRYTYATKPTINATLGIGRETIVGGTDKLYGVIPYVEPTNLAMIALSA